VIAESKAGSTVSGAALIDRVSEFEREARAVAATIERLPRSAEAIAAAVLRVVAKTAELAATERVASQTQPSALREPRIAIAASHDLPTELLDACRQLPGVFTGRTKHELAAADVGVTEAFAGIARTGTICVCVDYEDEGYISLLSRTHVAVLAAENIVERPNDLLRRDCLSGKGLDRNFVYITGPSATADMGPLVRGVHGPHWLHILILE
jgi:L-lactate dehydrogenase complex protein LldG